MTKPSVTKSNDRSAENSCVLCVIISFNCIASGKGFQIFVVLPFDSNYRRRFLFTRWRCHMTAATVSAPTLFVGDGA